MNLPTRSWIPVANSAIPCLMNRALYQARLRTGLTMEQVGDRVGSSGPQISRLEKGQRKLTREWAERLAAVYDCDPTELLFGDDGTTVTVTNTIGRGAELLPISINDMVRVKCPQGLNPESTAAAIVQGNVLLPLVADGWFVFYREIAEAKPDSLLHKVAIVELADGRRILCHLRPASQPGKFDIFAPNAAPEEMAVVRAYRVRALLPPDLVEAPTQQSLVEEEPDDEDLGEAAPEMRKHSA